MLGSSYLASTYLGGETKFVALETGGVNATFTAGESDLTIVPASGGVNATFTANQSLVFAVTGGVSVTWAYVAIGNPPLIVYLPSNQPGIAHGAGHKVVTDPRSIDFGGDPQHDPGHLHSGKSLVNSGQASGGTLSGVIAALVSMGILSS